MIEVFTRNGYKVIRKDWMSDAAWEREKYRLW